MWISCLLKKIQKTLLILKTNISNFIPSANEMKFGGKRNTRICAAFLDWLVGDSWAFNATPTYYEYHIYSNEINK